MEQFIQTLAVGVADGSVYGALALGLVLIHRSSGIVNFAQGALAMFATFLVYEAFHLGVPMIGAMLLVAAVAIGFGAVAERVAIRPVVGGDILTVVILTVGFSLLLESVAAMLWGGDNRPLPSIFGSGSIDVAGVIVTWHTVGTVALLLALTGAISAFLRRTEWGLAVRAGAIDAETSRLLGIPVGRTAMLGWGVAVSLGVVAGTLIAPRLYLDVTVMSTVLIYALAAACLGGFDSVWGAMVAGWVVGLADAIATGYVGFIGSDLRSLVPLAVIVLTLTLKPTGIFGTTQAVRV